MRPSTFRRFAGFALALALVALTAFSFGRSNARAAAATYIVLVGGSDSGSEAMGFFPGMLEVHRGDTVIFKFNETHNVRFAAKAVPLAVVAPIDGKPAPQINPMVAFPTAKSGDTYKPGLATGIKGPEINPKDVTFSVVMDTAVGDYAYLCDIHVGMVGTIRVVDDSMTIPSPDDVAKASQASLDATIAAGKDAFLKMTNDGVSTTTTDTLDVIAGSMLGETLVTQFFPRVGIIHVGQSVRWTMAAMGSDTMIMDGHNIAFPAPAPGSTPAPGFSVVMDKAGLPHFVLSGPLPTKSGVDYDGSTPVLSDTLTPGQSFTLHFTKAGVYTYYCTIHPDVMSGTIVVLP